MTHAYGCDGFYSIQRAALASVSGGQPVGPAPNIRMKTGSFPNASRSVTSVARGGRSTTAVPSRTGTSVLMSSSIAVLCMPLMKRWQQRAARSSLPCLVDEVLSDDWSAYAPDQRDGAATPFNA